MGKALAIDYGKKRSGLAITDELQLIASPLEGVETAELWKRLEHLVANEKVSEFIVGDPDYYGDTNSHLKPDLEAFLKKLSKTFPQLPIHRVDESFSSREAMQAMVSGGMRKSKRRDKKTLDMVSPAVILQRWLEQKP